MSSPWANRKPERKKEPSPFLECGHTEEHNGNKKSAVKKSHQCPFLPALVFDHCHIPLLQGQLRDALNRRKG